MAPVEAKKQSGFDAFGVPLLSFNSDLGLGYGAVGGGYLYGEGHTPYRHALAVQAFFTNRGVQNHWLRYDGPQLIGSARIEARLEYRRETFTPYYGPGNKASPEVPSELLDPYYAYDRVTPAAWLRVRASPLGEQSPFHPYVGYGFRWNALRPYAGSLLEQQRPRGIEGGANGQVQLGALWDTRDDESDPTRGGASEVSLRLSAEPTGSPNRYGGLTLSQRQFWPLGTPRLILGERVVFDTLFGQVPFYEWTTIGGIQGAEGIGGMSSVRGVPRDRYGGNTKAFGNLELRFYPYDFPLLGAPVKVGGLLFADLGRVWHPDVDDGPNSYWHTGVGTGLRLARRAAVLRFDYGYQPVAHDNRVYLTFGHMF